jgi:hypothetical protein
MLPNNLSETHAESGDPLLLDEAETAPLIHFKLVCADLGIGRRTGGRRAPLRDSLRDNCRPNSCDRSRHGAPDRKTQRMPLRTRRSFTRGTPRGLFGNIGLMAAHSWSVSS